jgi:serine phosphatase RsbU (regulator of sigma subunit)
MTFRLKLFLSFLLMGVVLESLVLWQVYVQVERLPAQITQEMVMSAVGNAAAGIDPSQVSRLRDALARAVARAEAEEPDVPLGQTAAFAEFAGSADFAALRGRMVAIDELPPHFGQEVPGRPAERLVGPRGYEKDVYLVAATETAGVGRILVAVRPEDAGRLYDMRPYPAMMSGWEGISSEQEITEDRFGRSLCGWAPIRDAEGRTVALLGIDAPAAPIEEFADYIAWRAAGLMALTTAISVVAAFYLSGRINRPIRRLADGMDRLAGGEDAHVSPIRTGDEFERLIGQFNRMVDGLQERDRLRQSLVLAMEIQQNLLPHDRPSVEGFDIAGSVDYCDETGGDYFDFIDLVEVAPGRVGIAIGDVTGHGIAASLLMCSARAALRMAAGRHLERLDLLLAELNRHLVRDTGDMRFMTLFYGVLDARAGHLLYASAGHDPVLHLHASDGRTTHLASTGIPLGILGGAEYAQEGPVAMSPGDVLLLSTDGVREAANGDEEQFGERRLIETLRASSHLSAEEVRDAVVRAVRDFQGPHAQEDDIALVVVKRQ